MPTFTLRNEMEGPYVVRTVIEWPPLTGAGEAPTEEQIADACEGLSTGKINDLTDEVEAKNAEIKALEEERAELLAEIAPHREACGMCQPGHEGTDHDGVILCARHGKRIVDPNAPRVYVKIGPKRKTSRKAKAPSAPEVKLCRRHGQPTPHRHAGGCCFT